MTWVQMELQIRKVSNQTFIHVIAVLKGQKEETFIIILDYFLSAHSISLSK